MDNTFKTGDTVTWGSGEIAAVVKGPAEKSEVPVALSKDYKSPCGRVWPKGMTVRMPVNELRPLQ